jgi:hypothetical protein
MEWCNQPTLSILDLQNQKVYKISEIYHHYYDLTSNTKWSSQDLSKIQSHIRNQNENHYCGLTKNPKHFLRHLTCSQSKFLDQTYEEYGTGTTSPQSNMVIKLGLLQVNECNQISSTPN